MIGGSFTGSKFIPIKSPSLPICFRPASVSRLRSKRVRVVAYDGTGNKIYSRSKPGELASFDEALGFWWRYPQKDYILKSSGNNGGGSSVSASGRQKTMKRDAFDSLDIAGKQNALKDGVTIVD